MSNLIDKWCSLEETAEYLGVTKRYHQKLD